MNTEKSIKTITIPSEFRKKTTLTNSIYYDTLEICANRVVGYYLNRQTMSWFFKDYTGIDFVKANMNSQFAQVVFLTGINSKNRAIGVDFMSTQNINAIKDTNRILFCSGMFSFKKTNDYASEVEYEIRAAFDNYRNRIDEKELNMQVSTSSVDELKKYKELLDDGVITQEDFEKKKKQLLGL